MFLVLAAGGLTGLPGAAQASPPAGAAAARIGRRIRATLPGPDLRALRTTALPGPASLARQVAADHRAGRILRVDGISLAVSEAAWCLACAEARAPA